MDAKPELADGKLRPAGISVGPCFATGTVTGTFGTPRASASLNNWSGWRSSEAHAFQTFATQAAASDLGLC